VDVLLVVDDSYVTSFNTWAGSSLGPALADTLVPMAEGGLGAHSIHLGVVTGDLGLLGSRQATSPCGDVGDAAELRVSRDATCVANGATERIVVGLPGAPSALSGTVFCAAQQGSGGCWLQQPLEAALSPGSPTGWTAASYVAPSLAGTLTARMTAGGPNDGFLRAQSLLVVIVVGSFDDCSAPSPEDVVRDETLSIPESCRVAELHGSELYALDRYVSGFAGLRRDPSHVLFVGITGIPFDAHGQSFDEILARPDMAIDMRTTACSARAGPRLPADGSCSSPPVSSTQVRTQRSSPSATPRTTTR
jgi:hypothetical protein